MQPKLTTIAACRVVGLDRQRFNEYVAGGDYICAPNTIPGRSRLFDPDDMLALSIFKREMDHGQSPAAASRMGCTVAKAARAYPDAELICVREGYMGTVNAYPYDHPNAYAIRADGITVYKITTFNVAQLRALIQHDTEEEQSIIGPDDE